MSLCERDEQILSLWVSGKSERDLAKKFDLSPGRIHQILAREQQKRSARDIAYTDAVRGGALQRLDVLEEGLLPAATAGNPKAVLALLKVMERRAKLLGLDAPKKVQLSQDNTDYAALRAKLFNDDAGEHGPNPEPGQVEEGATPGSSESVPGEGQPGQD